MGNSNEKTTSKDSSDKTTKRDLFGAKNDPTNAVDRLAAASPPKPINMFPQRPVAILHCRDGKWSEVHPPTIANRRKLNILTYNIWFDSGHRRRRFEALMDLVFSPKDCGVPDVVCFQVS